MLLHQKMNNTTLSCASFTALIEGKKVLSNMAEKGKKHIHSFGHVINAILLLNDNSVQFAEFEGQKKKSNINCASQRT